MSGHSKWSTIKHKKAIIDAKRGGVFTKMGNAITVAVKKGGGVGDPDMNFALRLAVDKARSVNMPKENIERAIEKGLGKGGGQEIEELVLEGYGPGGVAIIVEAVTDSRNRTVSEIKNILEKNGGRLGEPGSVMYQFDRVGEIICGGSWNEKRELELIDLGMIDMEHKDGLHKLITSVEMMKGMRDYLADSGMAEVEMAMIYRPKITIKPVGDGFANLVQALDQHDDVQEIYANID